MSRSNRRTLTAIGLVAILALFIAIPVAWAQPTGTVSVAMNANLQTLDPQLSYRSSDASIHYHLFDSFLDRDDDMEIVPRIATAWENVSPTEWVFDLRDDVFFHNGEHLNADTIVWNIERIITPGFQQFAFMAGVTGAERLGDYQVEISTSVPLPMMPKMMSMFFILPPGYFEEVGEEEFRRHPIGSGPYEFVEWVQDSHLTMRANPDWWGGAPNIAEIIWRYLPDGSTRIAAARAGEVQIAVGIPEDQVRVIEADDELSAQVVQSIRTPLVRFFPDSPQGGGEPLNDVRVRQAINYAINVDSIINDLLGGNGTRIATLMTPAFEHFDPSIEPYPYDPELARQLLADAGYPDGFTIGFESWSDGSSPKPVEVAQAIADDLAAVGITAELRFYEAAAMFPMQYDRTLAPLHIWSWGGSMLDPHDKFFGVFHPTSSATFLVDPEVVALIDQGQKELDTAVREQIYVELQHMVRDRALSVPLLSMADVYAVSNSIDWRGRADQIVRLWKVSFID